MDRLQIVVRNSSLLVFAAVLAATVQSANGQAKKPAPPTTVLLVDTDDTCHLTVDDEDEGIITPDAPKKINVGLGSHIVKCVVENIPDLVWRKVIEAKSSEQAAAIVALKALHMQYDQAVGQVHQQQQKAAATEEKAKTDAAEFPEKLFRAIKGVWRVDVAPTDADPSMHWAGTSEENILELKSLDGTQINAEIHWNTDNESHTKRVLYAIMFTIVPPSGNLVADGFQCMQDVSTSKSGKNKNQPRTTAPCSPPIRRNVRVRFLDSNHLEMTGFGSTTLVMARSS